MGVPLHQHYPSDDDFQQEAISRVADSLVEQDEVTDLLQAVVNAGPELLRALSEPRVVSESAADLLRVVRELLPRVAGAIADLRKEDAGRLTP